VLDIVEKASVAARTVGAATTAYDRLIDAGEERSLLQQFLDAWTRYRESHAAMVEYLETADPTSAVDEFNLTTLPAFMAATGKLDQLVDYSERASAEAIESAQRLYHRAFALIGLLVLAGGGCAFLAAVWTRRRVIVPLLATAAAMRRLAEGDVSVRVGAVRRKDEIGTLITAVAGYRDSLMQQRHLAAEAEVRERELLDAQRIARMGHWRLVLGTGAFEWSAGVHYLLGTDPARFTPMLRQVLERVHPDDREMATARLDGCAATGLPRQWELRMRTDGGGELLLWIDAHCEFDTSGAVVALFGVCQDVTEQRQLQASLRRSRDAAESANRAKSTFLATMSHELRTPLNAILGFSELLHTEAFGPLGTPRYRDYAGDIHHSGTHLLDLINDVLDMARIEAGHLQLEEEAIELRAMIEDVVHLVQSSTGDLGHCLEVRLPAPDPVVRADRRLLKQTLINLVGNAVKFTPDQGRILVSVAIGQSQVEIAVADTGIGIPSERIADLGQPFTQVENVLSRRHRGSGMGLYISRVLMERHGGTIRIESEQQVGSTITIVLPASRLVSSRIPERPEPEPSVAQASR
jgi:two-component system cell cycle sensor histidine kinase PleC